MAGGSLGALFGSEISKRFSNSFNDFGLEFFSIIFCNIIIFSNACLQFSLLRNQNILINLELNNVGGGSFDGIKNSLKRD